MQTQHPDLKLECEKIKISEHKMNFTSYNEDSLDDPNINSHITQAFLQFKRNLGEMYSLYMHNEDYKKFINVLNSSIRKKTAENGKKNLRFTQIDPMNIHADYDFSTLFDQKERQELSKDFVDSLTNQKFASEVKKEYQLIKNQNVPKIMENVDKFYFDEEKNNEKDQKARTISKKFVKSVKNYIENNQSEFKLKGILTSKGTINKTPGEYIRSQKDTIKKNFGNEAKLRLDDIDRLMNLKSLLA